ncbi:MAG: hemerythrin domain-containing protein [Planctomycetota bacterium]|jgi:hemerythrin-like domain-containing protein
MNPLDTLVREHELITSFLCTLARAKESLEQGENPRPELFVHAVRFARDFADKYHHRKEEYQMFVRLAQKENGALDGQVQALRDQHEHGRGYIAAIDAALAGYAEGETGSATKLLENLAAYISMLTRHVHTENHGFYPLVKRALTAEDMEALSAEFEKADEKAGIDFFERSVEQVSQMETILTQGKDSFPDDDGFAQANCGQEHPPRSLRNELPD